MKKIVKMQRSKREILADLYRNYRQLKNMLGDNIDEMSYITHRPQQEKVKVTKLLQKMQETLDQFTRLSQWDEDYNKAVVMMGVIDLYFGAVSVVIKNYALGSKHLMTSLDTMKGREIFPVGILIVVRALLQLKLCDTDIEEQIKYLKEAENTCESFFLLQQRRDVVPKTIDDLFGIRRTQIEATNELNYNYFKIELLLTSVYMRKNFKFESVLSFQKGFRHLLHYKDPMNMRCSMRAALFYKYFSSKCTSAPLFVVNSKNVAITTLIMYNAELEEMESKRLIIQKRNIARFKYVCGWLSHSIILLCSSDHVLLHITKGEDESCIICKNLNQVQIDCECSMILTFMETAQELMIGKETDTEKIAEQNYEDTSPDYEDAWPMFLKIHKWASIAKQCWSFDNPFDEYLKIMLGFTQLMLALTYFEMDDAHLQTLHAARIEKFKHLEGLVDETQISAQRTLWRELGSTYYQITELKLKLFFSSVELVRVIIKSEVNDFAELAVKYYTKYIRTFVDCESQDLPEKLPADCASIVLKAHYYICKLSIVLIGTDEVHGCKHKNNFVQMSELLINYCERDLIMKELMEKELDFCKSHLQRYNVRSE